MKEKLTRNIGLKLISVALAVFFWFAINNVIDPVTITTVANIPVKVTNLEAMNNAKKLVEITSGETISVKVRAKRSVANSLSVDDFDAVADVTNKNEFNAVPIIVSCNSYGDADIEILSLATEDGTTMLHLSLVDLVTRSFGIAIIDDGSVAEGYFVLSSSVSPNLVTIQGSETVLDRITRVAVITNVDGASSNISQTCTLQAYDSDGNVVTSENLTFSETQVNVETVIVPTKEVEVIVNTIGTPADGYYLKTLEYAPHYINIAGSADAISSINRITLSCSISDADCDMETSLDVAAAIADLYGDTVIPVNDSQKISVRATVSEYESRTMSVSTDKIEIRNLGTDLTLEIDQSKVDIVLKGPEKVLNALVSTDINAYIDASYFKNEGTYSAVIVYIEPIQNVTCESVTVDIVVKSVEPIENEKVEE